MNDNDRKMMIRELREAMIKDDYYAPSKETIDKLVEAINVIRSQP